MTANALYAYKYLNADGTPCNGGSSKWHLPTGNRPGIWMPPIKNIAPCQRGYHLCRKQDLLSWSGPVLALAEYRGKTIVHQDSKLVVEQARIIKVYTTWNERTQRLFTCDCAEHVAHLYTPPKGTTWKPMDTIEIARRYANGQATAQELAAARAAAEDAGAAVWAVARDAARAAVWAAWDAAWEDAGAAARAVARAAARAAGAAAGAAWDAPWEDAGAAGEDAGAAEHQWETARLTDYIEGRIP